jgi:hypothetical protein
MNFRLFRVVLFAASASLFVSATNAQTTFTNSVIKDKAGNVLDAGFYHWSGDTVIHEYSDNNGSDQQWSLNNGHICDAGTSLCLKQSGSALIQASGGDTFAVASSGSGYTIRDQSGSYINPAVCTSTCGLTLNSTAYIWSIPGATSISIGSGGGTNATFANSVIKDSKGNVFDAGFYTWTGDSMMHEYAENDGGDQLWTINNGHICDVGGTGLCLKQSGSALIQAPGGDTFTVISSANGFTIKNTSGAYINPAVCTSTCDMAFSSNAYVWSIPGAGSGSGTATEFNDTVSGIVYNVGANPQGLISWNYSSGSCADFKCDEHSSDLVASGGSVFQGASVSIPINGTAITWIGKKGPTYGIASWSIDGGVETRVDNYNSTELDQQRIVSASGLTQGPHILRIMLTTSTSGSDHKQTIDAMQVTGSLLTFSQGTVAGWDNSSPLIFSGNWGGGSFPDDLSGGHWWDGKAGDSVSWTFSGKTLITAWGRPDLENGVMNVYLDGSLVKQTSTRYGGVDNDSNNSTLLFAAKVSSAEHTIKLSPAGYGDGGPGRNLVQFDQFAAW